MFSPLWFVVKNDVGKLKNSGFARDLLDSPGFAPNPALEEYPCGCLTCLTCHVFLMSCTMFCLHTQWTPLVRLSFASLGFRDNYDAWIMQKLQHVCAECCNLFQVSVVSLSPEIFALKNLCLQPKSSFAISCRASCCCSAQLTWACNHPSTASRRSWEHIECSDAPESGNDDPRERHL